MNTYAYGHDFGNSDTCGVTWVNGKLVFRVMPSYTAIGTYDDLASVSHRFESDEYIFKQGEEEYYVGNLALRQGVAPESGAGNIARYWSKRSVHLLLTTAASMIPDKEFRLEVVTGLPVETYVTNESARLQIKTLLENGGEPYEFSFFNGDRRLVYVHVDRVLMEGAGAMIAYGTNEPVRQGAIDIGGRTIDLYTAMGQKPQRPLCKGKALGIEAVAQRMSDIFNTRYHRPLFPQERRDILRAYVSGGAVTYPSLHVKGTKVENLRDLAKDAIHGIGQDIIGFLGSTWNRNEAGGIADDFARVVLVGGGTYYFKDIIKKDIPHLTVVNDPENANAYGYALFAKAQMNKVVSIHSSARAV